MSEADTLAIAASQQSTPGRPRRDASRPAAPRPAAPVPRAAPPGFFTALRALRTNPITVFAQRAYEDPVVTIGAFSNVMLVSDPVAIEHVLVGNSANYRKSLQQRRRLEPALGTGLVTAEGEAWRSARRIASPLFGPRAIATVLEDMREEAERMRDRWLSRPGEDATIDVAAEFQRLAYEIVSRIVFSGALDEDRATMHAGMATYFDTLGRVDLGSLLRFPGWLPSLSSVRARPALRTFRTIVERAVSRRAADPDRGEHDLLDRLMRVADPVSGRTMDRTAIADNVLTFLAAGHETTGNALSWILYLLALHPGVERQLLDEIEAESHRDPTAATGKGGFVLTRAVINEALRLYPPAPFIGREACRPDLLCDREVKPGTQVIISPWVVHRHRRLWSDPDAFRPERFLPGSGAPVARGAFLPFGLGPRICIGQGFAIQEILTVLRTILPVFRFGLAHPERVFPQARITLRPAGGLPMIVTRRTGAHDRRACTPPPYGQRL